MTVDAVDPQATRYLGMSTRVLFSHFRAAKKGQAA
jgi:hypothetical protein